MTERERVQAELATKDAQLEEAQALAHVGSWEIDLQTFREEPGRMSRTASLACNPAAASRPSTAT